MLFDIQAKLIEMQADGKDGNDVAQGFSEMSTKCAGVLGGTIAQVIGSDEFLAEIRADFLADVADEYDRGFNHVRKLNE